MNNSLDIASAPIMPPYIAQILKLMPEDQSISLIKEFWVTGLSKIGESIWVQWLMEGSTARNPLWIRWILGDKIDESGFHANMAQFQKDCINGIDPSDTFTVWRVTTQQAEALLNSCAKME